MNTSDALWLCLNFPLLPVEVFCRQESSPVVVMTRQRVSFMNQPARSIGIMPGSSMSTAYTISDHVVSFERDEDKELRRLEHLAQWAYQFTPCVSLAPPQNLLLEISGCLKLFRGLANLKKSIHDRLSAQGYTVKMGVNGTPQAALCSATAALNDNIGDVRESLAEVAVQELHIDDVIIEKLNQMGVNRCRQLLALPTDGLNRRFGEGFTNYLDRLTGVRPDPRRFITDKPAFASEITFLADVSDLNSLLFPIKRLLGELHDFLRSRQLQVNQFTLRLAHRSHAAQQFTITLANPENNPDIFLMLTQLKLTRIRDMPEVDCISLHSAHFSESGGASGDLFHGTRFQQKDGRTHSKAEATRAVTLLNMMVARLGQDSCFGLSLANDHRPELAWKTVSLQNRDHWCADVSRDNARPAYLLATPSMLQTRDDSPYLSGKLTLLQGPERIDFGWWDHREVNRDYYIARHPCGAIYWVYHQVANNQWYLHGIFS